DPAVLERMAAHAVPPAAREQLAALSRSLAHAGNLYAAGHYEAAEQLCAEIVPQAEALGDPMLAAAARARRGRVLGEMSRFPDAERELEHAFFAALAARDDDSAADAAVQLTAITGANLGRRDDGLRWGRQAEVLLALEGEREGDLAAALEHSLGLVAFTASDFPTAIAHLQRGLELRTRNHGEHSLAVARALKALGAAYARNENPDAAIEHLERSLRLSEELLGPDHPMVGDASNDLGVALLDIDRSARSPDYFERAVNIYEAAGLEEKVPNALDNLSISMSERGDLQQALDYNARALEMRERMLPAGHPAIGDALVNRAALLDQAGKQDEGIPLLRRAIEVYEITLGKEHEKISDATFNLTEQLLNTGAGTEALAAARRTLELRRKGLRAGHPRIDQAILLLAMASEAMAQPQLVIPELEHALAESSDPPRNPMVAAQLRLALAEAKLATGEGAAALAAVDEVELDALHPPDRAQATFVRGKALWESGGDHDEARRLANEALLVLRDHPSRAQVVVMIERWLADHR
ncbi:MAG TPA: tetratricopeptide repeat protein, partial [Nannocystaceae bacterium]|nr:tetratricopeptide repeat protein [Nannocystaceae bacterium]